MNNSCYRFPDSVRAANTVPQLLHSIFRSLSISTGLQGTLNPQCGHLESDIKTLLYVFRMFSHLILSLQEGFFKQSGYEWRT
jgi:hypothetical protein